MDGANLFTASLYKYMEMSSSPNATSVPGATKSHHFTNGQISIFFIIAILIIAGIISIIYCFYLRKKNIRRLNADIHDPFRTKKIVNPHRNDINTIDQDDDNSITSLREISDIEDKNENIEQDNENITNNNSGNNDDLNTDKNPKEDDTEHSRIQRTASHPIKSKHEPLEQKKKINTDDDFNFNRESKTNENLIKFNEI